MKNFELEVQRERWLNHTLCRRYAAMVFSTIADLPLNGRPPENRTISWAFGCLVNGESECLGAWILDGTSATPANMFGDLHHRGVEFIRCGLGNLGDVEAAFNACFRNAVLYPSIEQTIAAAVGAVRPRHRAAMSGLLRASLGDADEPMGAVALAGFSSDELRQKYPGILGTWGEAVARFQPLFELPEPYGRLVRSVDRTAIRMQERLMRAIQRHGPFVDLAAAFGFVVDWLWRADLCIQRVGMDVALMRNVVRARLGRFLPVAAAVGAPSLA
jgi:transposase-like protein